MHTTLRIGEEPNFKGFSLSLTVANEAEAGRIFGALAEGGQVQCPSAKLSGLPVSACSPTALASGGRAASCIKASRG
jgi:hypothetical protein